MAIIIPPLDGERPGRDRTPSHSGDTVKSIVDWVVDIARVWRVGFECNVDDGAGMMSVLHPLHMLGRAMVNARRLGSVSSLKLRTCACVCSQENRLIENVRAV